MELIVSRKHLKDDFDPIMPILLRLDGWVGIDQD